MVTLPKQGHSSCNNQLVEQACVIDSASRNIMHVAWPAERRLSELSSRVNWMRTLRPKPSCTMQPDTALGRVASSFIFYPSDFLGLKSRGVAPVCILYIHPLRSQLMNLGESSPAAHFNPDLKMTRSARYPCRNVMSWRLGEGESIVVDCCAHVTDLHSASDVLDYRNHH